MPNDYKYIRLWGRYLGSNHSYIQHQVELAREDGAPSNAVYKAVGLEDRGHIAWHTTHEITNPVAREALGLGPLPDEGR